MPQCRSTDDNYYCFGLAEEAGTTPHQPACHVPRCSTLPPSQALTHVRQERAPRSASPAGIIRFPHAFSSTHCISLHIMPVGQRWLAASQAAQGRQRAGLPGNGKADMPTVVSTTIPGLDIEANFRLMATIPGRCCSPLHLPDMKCLNWECNRKQYFLLDLVLKQKLILEMGLHL